MFSNNLDISKIQSVSFHISKDNQLCLHFKYVPFSFSMPLGLYIRRVHPILANWIATETFQIEYCYHSRIPKWLGLRRQHLHFRYKKNFRALFYFIFTLSVMICKFFPRYAFTKCFDFKWTWNFHDCGITLRGDNCHSLIVW